MTVKLNLGCGEFHPRGWVNVDAQDNSQVAPDVVADITKPPFADGCAERIYAGHVLEHLPFGVARGAVIKWRRLLAPGGALFVVGPDCIRASALRELGKLTQAEWIDIRWGACRWPGDEHQWESTTTLTKRLLNRAGWNTTEIALEDAAQFAPVASFVEWQFALMAVPI
jgi:hypothetical protein